MKISKKLLCLALSVSLMASCEKQEETEVIEKTSVETIQPGEKGNLKDYRISYADNTKDRTNFDDIPGVYASVFKKGGTVQIKTNNSDYGHFVLDYQNSKNVVGGIGWKGGSNRIINYKIEYLYGDISFAGVYGWTKYPNVEYYIIEYKHGDSQHENSGYDFVKEYWTDGNHYKLYKKWIEDEPCALAKEENGTCNFWRYKAIRQDTLKNYATGYQTINMGNHQWNMREEGIQAHKRKGNGFGEYTQYQLFGIEGWDQAYNSIGGIKAHVY